MTDPMDDIIQQARSGSVAAIIQILNEKLADTGVRTRAMFADGVLQLLCEASTVTNLQQSTLVDRIRQILESLAPRRITRVKINSRIVREQQLLWLEDITRDPENQLLWAEEITLVKPNIFQRLLQDIKEIQNQSSKHNLSKTPSSRQIREKRQFWRGILGGTSISLVLLFCGWLVFAFFTQEKNQKLSNQANNNSGPVSLAVNQKDTDAFARAVALAEQASQEGKKAKTPAQWLDIATKWQKASDLMGNIDRADARYKTAQDRMQAYLKNSEIAQQEAQRRRSK